MTDTTTVGYLELFIGPMFSGKTSRLLEIYKKLCFCGNKPIVINFSGDNRYTDYDTHLSTHDERKIPCVRSGTLNDIFDISNTPDVTNNANNNEDMRRRFVDDTYSEFSHAILINEAQFFPDLYNWVTFMINKLNKHVYIAGLDGDFKQAPIGQILQLIPHCNNCTKLNSLCYKCKDGTPAIFSHRITEETEQVVIGVNNYIPLCRKCHM
jgi:thymidine kinase